MSSVEIHCPVCDEDALLIRDAVYDGFTKTSDRLTCSQCGHQFDNEEEIPFKEKESQSVFTDADRSHDSKVFEADSLTMCHRCKNYVVNPFMQWCDHHRKEVEATDTCAQFKPRPEKETPIL